MPPEQQKLLKDMQDAAAEIVEFTAGHTFEDFLRDKQKRRAVERSFEIIGEALTKLRKLDQTTAEKISDWQSIIGFRNVLIHGYGQVDHAKTWDIVQTELPILQRELNHLLVP